MATIIVSSKIPTVTASSSPTTNKFKPNLHFHSSNFSFPTPLLFNKNNNIKVSSESLSYVTAVAASSATAGISENIADVLGEVSIYRASGEPVVFKDLLDNQNQGVDMDSLGPEIVIPPDCRFYHLQLFSSHNGMVVVALLRHFGCPCCWELASELKESKTRFDSAGVKLIAVGVGSPEKARMLAERLPFPLDCLYADPERKAYDVLGLYYGFGRTFFNPASAKVLSRFESLKKAVKNYTIEATPNDRSGVLQQGGMFVFKGNNLLFARKDEGTGDHAPLDDIFDICSRVLVA